MKNNINMKYKPQEIEAKWTKKWEEEKIYQPDLEKAANPFYNLWMFPYPSGEGLHAGHAFASTGADIYGRFMRMNGKDVFQPIGYDSFGIHSENFAIKMNQHPEELIAKTTKNFEKQLKSLGLGYDWTRKVTTSDQDYYKWTQWIFIQMFKKGLAVRKKAPVNYCPSCKTVLADEQVLGGKCERCDTEVVKKELEQWFFKITEYAERLLSNTSKLDWTEKVKIAQTNWIGKSEGMRIEFEVKDVPVKTKIPVFTTRPDTLHGATFLVIAPEHPLVEELLKTNLKDQKLNEEIENYVKEAGKKSDRDRITEGKEKSGVFSGFYALNPLNDKHLPIWIADYVLMGYGTGAIMAVPAHDQRDFEFAKKYDLEIIEVIKSKAGIEDKAYIGEGELINSDKWDGWQTPSEIAKVISDLETRNIGKKETQYHLRDWLISRQRYWSPPIPMIHCEKCGWNPVPEEELPVKLPRIEDYRPIGADKSPLASHPEFYNVKCPVCKGDAVRETDVSDTFLDSAWYFFRYTSTELDKEIFAQDRVKKWLPVHMYIGGAEHSVLHLLYARFMTMFLYDLGLIDFEEPFKRFFAHGLLIKEGAKMSKSRGNVVVPDAYIAKYGADTMRCYLMFLGQFSQGGDFYDSGIEGMNRFINRIWKLSANIEITEEEEDKETIKWINKTIKGVTEDIERLSYNTSIAKLMEFYNFLSKKKSVSEDIFLNFLKLLAPFSPFLAEEIYQSINKSANFSSIHLSSWPQYDEKFLKEEELIIVVQVNGKVRDTIKIQDSKIKDQKEIENLAREGKAKGLLEGEEVKKVIYVEGKIINFVV